MSDLVSHKLLIQRFVHTSYDVQTNENFNENLKCNFEFS